MFDPERELDRKAMAIHHLCQRRLKPAADALLDDVEMAVATSIHAARSADALDIVKQLHGLSAGSALSVIKRARQMAAREGQQAAGGAA